MADFFPLLESTNVFESGQSEIINCLLQVQNYSTISLLNPNPKEKLSLIFSFLCKASGFEDTSVFIAAMRASGFIILKFGPLFPEFIQDILFSLMENYKNEKTQSSIFFISCFSYISQFLPSNYLNQIFESQTLLDNFVSNLDSVAQGITVLIPSIKILGINYFQKLLEIFLVSMGDSFNRHHAGSILAIIQTFPSLYQYFVHYYIDKNQMNLSLVAFILFSFQTIPSKITSKHILNNESLLYFGNLALSILETVDLNSRTTIDNCLQIISVCPRSFFHFQFNEQIEQNELLNSSFLSEDNTFLLNGKTIHFFSTHSLFFNLPLPLPFLIPLESDSLLVLNQKFISLASYLRTGLPEDQRVQQLNKATIMKEFEKKLTNEQNLSSLLEALPICINQCHKTFVKKVFIELPTKDISWYEIISIYKIISEYDDLESIGLLQILTNLFQSLISSNEQLSNEASNTLYNIITFNKVKSNYRFRILANIIRSKFDPFLEDCLYFYKIITFINFMIEKDNTGIKHYCTCFIPLFIEMFSFYENDLNIISALFHFLSFFDLSEKHCFTIPTYGKTRPEPKEWLAIPCICAEYVIASYVSYITGTLFFPFGTILKKQNLQNYYTSICNHLNGEEIEITYGHSSNFLLSPLIHSLEFLNSVQKPFKLVDKWFCLGLCENILPFADQLIIELTIHSKDFFPNDLLKLLPGFSQFCLSKSVLSIIVDIFLEIPNSIPQGHPSFQYFIKLAHILKSPSSYLLARYAFNDFNSFSQEFSISQEDFQRFKIEKLPSSIKEQTSIQVENPNIEIEDYDIKFEIFDNHLNEPLDDLLTSTRLHYLTTVYSDEQLIKFAHDPNLEKWVFLYCSKKDKLDLLKNEIQSPLNNIDNSILKEKLTQFFDSNYPIEFYQAFFDSRSYINNSIYQQKLDLSFLARKFNPINCDVDDFILFITYLLNATIRKEGLVYESDEIQREAYVLLICSKLISIYHHPISIDQFRLILIQLDTNFEAVLKSKTENNYPFYQLSILLYVLMSKLEIPQNKKLLDLTLKVHHTYEYSNPKGLFFVNKTLYPLQLYDALFVSDNIKNISFFPYFCSSITQSLSEACSSSLLEAQSLLNLCLTFLQKTKEDHSEMLSLFEYNALWNLLFKENLQQLSIPKRKPNLIDNPAVLPYFIDFCFFIFNKKDIIPKEIIMYGKIIRILLSNLKLIIPTSDNPNFEEFVEILPLIAKKTRNQFAINQMLSMPNLSNIKLFMLNLESIRILFPNLDANQRQGLVTDSALSWLQKENIDSYYMADFIYEWMKILLETSSLDQMLSIVCFQFYKYIPRFWTLYVPIARLYINLAKNEVNGDVELLSKALKAASSISSNPNHVQAFEILSKGGDLFEGFNLSQNQ